MLWCIVIQCEVSSKLVTAFCDVILNEIGAFSDFVSRTFSSVELRFRAWTDMFRPLFGHEHSSQFVLIVLHRRMYIDSATCLWAIIIMTIT